MIVTKRNILGLGMLVSIMIAHFLIRIPISAIQTECERLLSINNNSSWQIVESDNVQAGILWEKSVFVQDAVIAASDKLLLFNQNTFGCSYDNHVVAVDNTTGQKVWAYAVQDNRAIRGIMRVSDGFLITICCTTLIRLDDQGNQTWQSVKIPARIYRPNLFVTGNSFYFPTATKVHVLSLIDGQEQSAIDGSNALAAFDDFALWNTRGRTLEVENLQNKEIQWSTRLPSENTLSNFEVFRFGEVVVVVSGLQQMDAYAIDTGKQLWKVTGDFLAFPISVREMILTYDSDHQLIFYDGVSGNRTASLTLTRTSQSHTRNPSDIAIPAVLAVSKDKVFIWNNQSSELIALSYELGSNRP